MEGIIYKYVSTRLKLQHQLMEYNTIYTYYDSININLYFLSFQLSILCTLYSKYLQTYCVQYTLYSTNVRVCMGSNEKTQRN